METPHAHGDILLALAGMLGALVPEILRLYQKRDSLHRRKFSFSYFAISFVYAACGGALALILSASTLWAAFYIGATFPVTISGIMRRGRNRGPLANTVSGELEAMRIFPEKRSFRTILRDHARLLLP